MKNILRAASVAFALSLCSCSEDVVVEMEPQVKKTCFTAPDFEADELSRTSIEITDKAASFAWSATDTIGIFPDSDASQARFSMISGAGTKTATFNGGGWALKFDSKYAAYYPYIPSVYLDKTAIPVDYMGQVQLGANSTSHLGSYDFMAAIAVVPNDGEVAFNFKHLNSLVQLKLTLPKAASYSSITLRAEKKLFPIRGKYNLMATDIEIESLVLQDSIVLGLKDVETTVDGQEMLAYLMLAPIDLVGQDITVVARGTDGFSAQGQLQMKNMVAGTAYSYTSTLKALQDEDDDDNDDDENDEGENTDGVTMVNVAGTLEALLGDSKFSTSKLVLKGKLNSDDVALLRRMSGGFRDTTDVDFGILKELDMSQAQLVPGGTYYMNDGKNRYKIVSSDELGNCMFWGCSTLESVILPKDISIIGEAALSSCLNLKNVVIPESVIEVKIAAFNSCRSLTELQLPGGLQEIGSDAFHGCSNLQRIKIPEGVTSIAANTFGHCTSLNEVILPDGLISIGTAVFAACDQLEKIIIPNSVMSIGERAFGSCYSLADVTLSSGQTVLGSYVFENCPCLQSIVIPEGITTIESRAFNGCSKLKEFTLPSTLTRLNDRAFYAAALMEPIVVRCLATNPPIVGSSVWKGGSLAPASKLYVPAASIEKYKSSEWSTYFGEILAIE